MSLPPSHAALPSTHPCPFLRRANPTGRIWGRGPRRLPHLGDSRLKDDVSDGLRGRAQHGDHHHQHVRPLGQGVLGEVEEDTEAVLVVHRHGEDAACGTGSAQLQPPSSQASFPSTGAPPSRSSLFPDLPESLPNCPFSPPPLPRLTGFDGLQRHSDVGQRDLLGQRGGRRPCRARGASRRRGRGFGVRGGGRHLRGQGRRGVRGALQHGQSAGGGGCGARAAPVLEIPQGEPGGRLLLPAG